MFPTRLIACRSSVTRGQTMEFLIRLCVHRPRRVCITWHTLAYRAKPSFTPVLLPPQTKALRGILCIPFGGLAFDRSARPTLFVMFFFLVRQCRSVLLVGMLCIWLG